MNIADLDRAVSGVYGGRLDEFVSARDALVSQLRAAGRTDDAKWVKALRKPSRQAWALNAAALEDPAVVERVERGTADVIQAQSGGGGLRARLDDLREAIRDVATAAGRAAVDAGHTADPASLAQAVSAVVGDSEAFAALRAGRLAAIPAATGLDLVASIPVAASGLATSTSTGRTAEDQPLAPAGDEAAAIDNSEIATIAAENAARRAETAASAARDRTATAARALDKAEANAAAADEQLRLARQRVDVTQADLDRARQDAEAAKAREREADEAAAHARAELERLTR